MGNTMKGINDTKSKKRNEIKIRAASYVIPMDMANYLVLEMDITRHQLQEVKEAFAAYDKSSRGRIPTKSLIYVMRSLGNNPTEEETHNMIYEANPFQRNHIYFVDFLEQWVQYTSDIHHNDVTIKEAFSLFDTDGSGTISVEEFRSVMMNEGAQMTDEEIDGVIGEFDTDGDGQISVKEFVRLLSGY